MVDANLANLQAQIGGNLDKSYSDYLRNKRELGVARADATKGFAEAFEPQGEGVYLNPADIFKAFQSFQTTVPTAAEGLQTEANLLEQIQGLGTTPGTSDQASDLLKMRKQLVDANKDTGIIDSQLDALGYGDASGAESGLDITAQINNLGTNPERKGARAVKDIMDIVDRATKKFREGQGAATGPLSALQAQFSKLTTPNQTAQLQKDLKEILRTIRKESTGVAFAPEEIKELENEIPTILQQEGNVEDSLVRLKQRMLQKLANYGIDTTSAITDTAPATSGYVPSYDEDAVINSVLGK